MLLGAEVLGHVVWRCQAIAALRNCLTLHTDIPSSSAGSSKLLLPELSSVQAASWLQLQRNVLDLDAWHSSAHLRECMSFSFPRALCSQDSQRCESLLLRHLERDAVLTSPHGTLTQAALSALTQMACAAPRDARLTSRCVHVKACAPACWPV